MKKYIDVLKRAYNDWVEDEAPRLGAALSYYTVLSLAPLLIVLVAVLALVFGQEAARGEIVAQFRGMVGEEGAREIQTIIESASKPKTGMIATALGVITLLFGASGVLAELRESLNKIWEAPKQASSGLLTTLRQRLFSLGMLLGIGFLLMVSLAVSAGLAAMGKFAEGWLPLPEPVFQALNILVSLVMITVLFALIFRYLPDVRLAWKDIWRGAFITAVLFTIGKFLLGFYLGKADVGSAYGAAGSLVILLVWIYYSSQIFFFGAEVAQVYAGVHESHMTKPAHEDQPEQKRQAVTAPQPQIVGRAPHRMATLLATLGFVSFGFLKLRRPTSRGHSRYSR